MRVGLSITVVKNVQNCMKSMLRKTTQILSKFRLAASTKIKPLSIMNNRVSVHMFGGAC